VLRVSSAGSPELQAAAEEGDATVATVGPTGVPAVEPLVSVTRDGTTAFYPTATEADVEGLVENFDEGVPTAGAAAVVEHDPESTTLPAVELSGLATGERVVLGGCGWCRPADPDDHEAAGGFREADRSAVVGAAAGLRGRGWGDWAQDTPVVETWETARDAEGDPAVVVNAHGTPADALLLESVPFDVLDGAAAVAEAVGADRVVLYASEADETAVETAREAVVAHPDPPIPTEVVTGPDDYRATEPTMALEAIEGNHRLEARLRPPGPQEVGLFGRPTVVHTARTVAHLAAAVRDEGRPGTRIVTVDGDVTDPVTVELPEDGDFEAALSATSVDGGFKAACVGGRFGGLTDSLSVAPDPEALSAVGLGTEGTVEILAEDRCVVEFVGTRASFAAEENCGRCVPCREGTTQLADLLRDLYDGHYPAAELTELDRVMETSSICQFGVDAGRPVRTAMDVFDAEFEAHAEGHCPAEGCALGITV